MSPNLFILFISIKVYAIYFCYILRSSLKGTIYIKIKSSIYRTPLFTANTNLYN